MKLKHWQGYGTVNAKKVFLKTNGETKHMLIRVTGDHEYGIRRDDKYDVFNWLVKRFDKTADDYRKIERLEVSQEYNLDGENCCEYDIVYRS